ncbi:MAG: hypothetical protein JSW00_01875 [Thermoplasmata archaeon]|nr:MAG: hypothetical protein JSW00_01875 [Thermoplasmata archaeon]
MPEDEEYEVKAGEKKPEDVEEKIDKKIEEMPKSEGEPSEPTQKPRKVFQVPSVPTEKIFKTLTDKEMMKQALHDETLEPHVHLAILILIVFILAIIITLIGI